MHVKYILKNKILNQLFHTHKQQWEESNLLLPLVLHYSPCHFNSYVCRNVHPSSNSLLLGYVSPLSLSFNVPSYLRQNCSPEQRKNCLIPPSTSLHHGLGRHLQWTSFPTKAKVSPAAEGWMRTTQLWSQLPCSHGELVLAGTSAPTYLLSSPPPCHKGRG